MFLCNTTFRRTTTILCLQTLIHTISFSLNKWMFGSPRRTSSKINSNSMVKSWEQMALKARPVFGVDVALVYTTLLSLRLPEPICLFPIPSPTHRLWSVPDGSQGNLLIKWNFPHSPTIRYVFSVIPCDAPLQYPPSPSLSPSPRSVPRNTQQTNTSWVQNRLWQDAPDLSYSILNWNSWSHGFRFIVKRKKSHISSKGGRNWSI